MIAMIFAAGLGVRLRPLTDNKPKALVNFMGKTMLENAAEKLVEAGAESLVINVHHFAGAIKDFLKNKDFGVPVYISDESDMLLDTGGGMLKAKTFLNKEDDFILHNVDIASNINLKKFFDFHKADNAIATLAVKERESTRNLIFDNENNLCGWKNYKTGEKKKSRSYSAEKSHGYAFSGISAYKTEIFEKITESGKFSIVNMLLRIAKQEQIKAYVHNNDLWADLGTVEKLEAAEKLFSQHNF